jgi:hypothetical protein
MTEEHRHGIHRRQRAHRAAFAVGLGITVMTAAVALASPAASEAAATSGAFAEYASGPGLGYDDISGHAQLVRTSNGRTIATVEITGLNPSTTYAVHVHALGCADLAGHYFFAGPVPDGDGPNANEIWPGPITANAAGNARGSSTVGAVAGATARSIVVHATSTGGARIACADLA